MYIVTLIVRYKDFFRLNNFNYLIPIDFIK